MSPLWTPSQKRVLRMLARPFASRRLPIVVGNCVPEAEIVRIGKRWVMRYLVVETARYDAFVASSEPGTLLPEMTDRFRVPGPTLIDAGSKAELIEAIRGLSWTFGGQDDQ
jgi:hypothetical protein